MTRRPEPEGVDFSIGDVGPDPGSDAATIRAIAERKRRPGYPLEAEEAERILAEIGVDFRDHGMRDAQSLLDHWHRCVEDLDADPEQSGNPIDREIPSR
ncbi:hypothetical protein HK102_011031 [Quaeritorhiza haematococci]|nr:hypothetical protein HK102_011031 [Quaeritorhiza haematococci]